MEECFVVGSGRSLLDLRPEEVSHVNECDFVLSFNKHLVFYRKVGIVPTHYMMLDAHPPADLVLYEALRRRDEDRLSQVELILHESWRRTIARASPVSAVLDLVVSNPVLNSLPLYRLVHRVYAPLNPRGNRALGLKMALYLWRQRSYLLSRAVFVTCTNSRTGGEWATRMDQTIFHFRGTLTSAINVAHILHPASKIKLLGVDLKDNSYFFDEEIARSPARWQDWTARIPNRERHTVALPLMGVPGIQDCLPFVAENLGKTGSRLVCCNRNSYLVEAGLLDYEPVID